MRTPSNSMLVSLAWIVMPRSRSRSSLSITRSATTWLDRKAPVKRSSASTSVVLPWSTCAMIARLRRSLRDSAMGMLDAAPSERERELHVLAVDAVAVLEECGVERFRDDWARVAVHLTHHL